MGAPESEVPELNLTPMIDVVFQLVIFLMMANDIGGRDIAEVALPQAVHSTDFLQADGRLTVNLLPGTADGPPSLVFRGESIDLPRLEAELRAVRAARPGGLPPLLLIRADRTCPWRHVQLVLQACAGRGIEVHQVEFAAVKAAGGKP